MSEHRLNEIVIERPRHGMRISLKRITGHKKQLQKLTQEAEQDGLLNPYLIKPSRKSKYLSDHLNPLRRFLKSKVGQPWNQVHSELCQRLDRNTMTGRHVLDHVQQYVEEHVQLVDGVPYAKSGWYTFQPLGYYRWEQFYVHPETGLLCQVERRTSRKPSPPRNMVVLDSDRQYHKLNDIWYLITFEEFPADCPRLRDMLKGWITSDQASSIRGRKVYAARKQQCSKKEVQFILRQIAKSR